ncbi:hypothetical protein JCM4814A_01440 [Streptomyces phaeofaciens JCM 4814]|uniref:Acetyltransferase n=1 Tax=Streptomyces phaeofaciens TaxID=68254 RepID=A0A918M0S4_9ACTN|nr:hypothetical protein GCM10010226_85270 [Streptomyces phaeofaciens]
MDAGGQKQAAVDLEDGIANDLFLAAQGSASLYERFGFLVDSSRIRTSALCPAQ